MRYPITSPMGTAERRSGRIPCVAVPSCDRASYGSHGVALGKVQPCFEHGSRRKLERQRMTFQIAARVPRVDQAG